VKPVRDKKSTALRYCSSYDNQQQSRVESFRYMVLLLLDFCELSSSIILLLTSCFDYFFELVYQRLLTSFIHSASISAAAPCCL
jgi:hypothetical protein